LSLFIQNFNFFFTNTKYNLKLLIHMPRCKQPINPIWGFFTEVISMKTLKNIFSITLIATCATHCFDTNVHAMKRSADGEPASSSSSSSSSSTATTLTQTELELLAAAQNGNLAKVQDIINKDSSIIETRDKYERTPLYLAAKHGHLEVVQFLIGKNASVESKNNDGATPLWIASQEGQNAVVQCLIDKHAKTNIKILGGQTPLHIASADGRTQVVRILLDNGADVDAKTDQGATSLHIASQRGRVAIATLLLDNGADIEATVTKTFSNSITIQNITPLAIACMCHNIEMFKLLISRGAKPERIPKQFVPLYHTILCDLVQFDPEGYKVVMQKLLGEHFTIETPTVINLDQKDEKK
jgi:ankyrin repeat protein